MVQCNQRAADGSLAKSLMNFRSNEAGRTIGNRAGHIR